MATTWCDQDDVEFILSAHGVAAFADDDEDGSPDAGVVAAAIERAAALRIGPLIFERYPNLGATLGNEFLKWANATLAALALCMRRNMPAPESLYREAGEIADFLNQVRRGVVAIPELREQFDHLPAVTNFHVQRGTGFPVRVDTRKSTGQTPHSSRRRKTRQAGYGTYRYY